MKRQGSDLKPSNERLSKTQRLTNTRDRHDISDMRRKMADIKETLEDLASEMKKNIGCIKDDLEEMYYEAREQTDNINSMLADLLAEIQQRNTID